MLNGHLSGRSLTGVRLGVLVFLLILSTSITAAAQARRNIPASSQRLLVAKATLRIENLRGNIQIFFSSRTDIEITAKRQAGNIPVRNEELAIEETSFQAAIITRPTDISQTIDLKITAPVGIGLRLFSENGNLEINGLAGNLLARTQLGNIALNLPERANIDLDLSAPNGNVQFSDSLKFQGRYESRNMYGRLGDGGAIYAAHSDRGQIQIKRATDNQMAVSNPTRPKDNTINRGNDEISARPIEDEPIARNEPRNPSVNSGSGAGGSSRVPIISNRDSDRNSDRDDDRDNRPAPQLSSAPPKRTTIPELRRPETIGENAPVEKTSSNNGDDDGVLRIESQLVTLNATVSRRDGKPLLDLSKTDFKLYDDRVEQEIVHFQSAQTPFNLVLLIDLSGSLREKLPLIRRAAWRFVQSTRPEDKVAVITFSSDTQLASPLTNDREELRRRIDRINRPDGGTNFYDAMYDTLVQVLGPVRGQRNAIVVMSDGVDNALPGIVGKGSSTSYAEMLETLQEADTIVFPIYIDTEQEAVDDFGEGVMRGYAMARQQLKELADVTGGAIFYARRVEDLEGRYEQVAAELRTIYSLGYYPTNTARDGSFHRINVKVSRTDAQVRSRRGYYAKRD